MSKPAVSQHLYVPKNARLVVSDNRGSSCFIGWWPNNLANTLNAYVQEVCPVSRPLKVESATSPVSAPVPIAPEGRKDSKAAVQRYPMASQNPSLVQLCCTPTSGGLIDAQDGMAWKKTGSPVANRRVGVSTGWNARQTCLSR